MLKYYVLLFLIVGVALFYAFVMDPCNSQLRTEFSNKYPSYEILNSGASEGSPESVRCHISYRKPESERIHEEIWRYRYSDGGWEFSRALETSKREQTP